MKIALYSDIHAQLAPLNAVLEDIDKENVDHEVIIGDMIMGGPEPSEVLERIRGREKAIPLLEGLFRFTQGPLPRMHALWTLHGMEALTLEIDINPDSSGSLN